MKFSGIFGWLGTATFALAVGATVKELLEKFLHTMPW